MKIPPRTVLFSALAIALAACGGSSISGTVGTPAHGVFVTAGHPQPGPQGDTVYLSIDNEGSGTTYLQQCGDNPTLDIQQWVNGHWQPVPQPLTACPAPTTPGPLELALGQTLVVTRIFTSGTFRVGVFVASKPDYTDVAESMSASFTVP